MHVSMQHHLETRREEGSSSKLRETWEGVAILLTAQPWEGDSTG